MLKIPVYNRGSDNIELHIPINNLISKIAKIVTLANKFCEIDGFVEVGFKNIEFKLIKNGIEVTNVQNVTYIDNNNEVIFKSYTSTNNTFKGSIILSDLINLIKK